MHADIVDEFAQTALMDLYFKWDSGNYRLLQASLMQHGIMTSALLKRADERVQVDSVDEFVQTTLIHLYFKEDSRLWEVGILGS